MTAPCGCLLRGRRGDTAGLAGRERPRNSSTAEVQSGYGYPWYPSRRDAGVMRRPRADGVWPGMRAPTPNSSAPPAPRSQNLARTRPAHSRHPAPPAVTAIGLTQSGGPEAVKAAASGCAAIALSELVFDHRRDDAGGGDSSERWAGAPPGACHQQHVPGTYHPGHCACTYRQSTGVVVTGIPATERADARACFVEGNELRKGLASGVLVCWRGRAGAGDHVA